MQFHNTLKKEKNMSIRKLLLPIAAVMTLFLASCNKEFHQFLVIENGTSDTLRIAIAERGQRNIGDVAHAFSTKSKVLAPDEKFLIYDELDDGYMQSETIDDVDPRLESILDYESKINNVRAYRHDTCIAIWEHPGEGWVREHPYGAEFNNFYNTSAWKTTKSHSAYTFTFTVKEENYYHRINYAKK